MSDDTTGRLDIGVVRIVQASAVACMIRSQEIIAAWQQSHPDWRVDNWRCVMRGKEEIPI